MERFFLSQLWWHRNRMMGMIGGIQVAMPLDQVRCGQWALVAEVCTKPQLRQRLREFGMVPGTRVRRRYTSPGGHVVAVELRGSVLALRKHDLHGILVRV